MDRERVYRSRFFAGQVLRYHVWPTITQQTVAAHCWRVTCILIEIFGLPRAEVLYFALHHDSGELWAGDVPYLIKANTPGLKELMDTAEAVGRRLLEVNLPQLNDFELAQVKISDLLEMHEYGEMEVNMGNSYAEPVMRDTMHAAQKLAAQHCVSDKVNRWLMDRGSLRR